AAARLADRAIVGEGGCGPAPRAEIGVIFLEVVEAGLQVEDRATRVDIQGEAGLVPDGAGIRKPAVQDLVTPRRRQRATVDQLASGLQDATRPLPIGKVEGGPLGPHDEPAASEPDSAP